MSQMTLNVTGAVPVDFENYRYIKVFVLDKIKNGIGSMTQVYKYHNLDDMRKFEHIEVGKVYPAVCEVDIETSSKGVEITIETIEFIGDKRTPQAKGA